VTVNSETDSQALENKQLHAADVVQVMDNLRGILEDNLLDTSVPTLTVEEMGNVDADIDVDNDNDNDDALSRYKHTHAVVRRDDDDDGSNTNTFLMSTQQLHLPDFSDRTLKDFASLNLDVSLKSAVK